MQPSQPTQQRRSYLITLTTTTPTERTAMRNALWRLNASELLPGLFLVSLTPSERQALARRFGGLRIRQR